MQKPLAAWNKPGSIETHTNQAGLEFLKLTGSFGSAEFCTQGAHLMHFTPIGGTPMLFVSAKTLLSPGKAIRGGIPVIFPWFGPRAGHPESPMHGLVRTRPWQVTEVTVPGTPGPESHGLAPAVVGFECQSNADTLALWPHEFRLELVFELGNSLHITWRVHNTGSTPFDFEQALHPYFPVKDVQSASVSGLQNAAYIDKTDHMTIKTQTEPFVRFSAETDRLFLDTAAELTLDDPAANQRLRIQKTGSNSSVVWNPWIAKAAALADLGDEEWREFVCVEQVNAAKNSIQLPAAKSYTMTASFTPERTA
jgi:D-hexose-6-phosphate mutarotase